MHNTILIRYGEIALKGKNRKLFEEKLISNIKLFLKNSKTEYDSINRNRGRILINTKQKCDFLQHVFGITSFSYAVKTELDIKKIEQKCMKSSSKLDKNKTFKVNTTRANKKFDLNSLEINKKIGEAIRNKTQAKVKLNNPDLTIHIEIADKAYIFDNAVKGPGGLPVGIEGQACVLIKDKNDILAGLLAMKRGCSIIPIVYKKTNIDLLKKFDPDIKLKIIKNLSDIDKEKALITGQSLETLQPTNNHFNLRPLIAYSDKEIAGKLNHYQQL